MATNDLADQLAWEIKWANLPEPEREYRFHPDRKWRFDLAYPDCRIAFECEGGIWSRGRHTRGQGFINDCEKYNAATLLGWRVFRLPGPWIESGLALEYVERVLNAEEDIRKNSRKRGKLQNEKQ